MPPEPDHIGFVAVQSRHYDLLRGWLAEPHVQEWWGDPDKEFGHIRDMVEGRDTTRPFIIELDGAPVGYIQCWFLGHYQNESWIKDNPWLGEVPSDAVGVDISLGDADSLSRGIGSAALAAFARRLFEAGHRTILIDPDCRNARAVRAYEKAGFRVVPELAGRTGETLIMQYHPNSNEMT